MSLRDRLCKYDFKNGRTLKQVVLGVLVRIVRRADDVERAPAGEHLVQQNAQCPPVANAVKRFLFAIEESLSLASLV